MEWGVYASPSPPRPGFRVFPRERALDPVPGYWPVLPHKTVAKHADSMDWFVRPSETLNYFHPILGSITEEKFTKIRMCINIG